VSRIEQKKPLGIEQLMIDFDIQDIITLNLERAVQQCIDIAMIALSNETRPITFVATYIVFRRRKRDVNVGRCKARHFMQMLGLYAICCKPDLSITHPKRSEFSLRSKAKSILYYIQILRIS